MKSVSLISFLAFGAFFTSVYSQTAKQKAEQIAAQFNKERHKDKEKNGVKAEVNVVVEAKPDIRENIASYAAKYEMDGFGDYIVFRQSAPGKWEGEYVSSRNGKDVQTATFKNIKIEDALLTAAMIDKDGKEKPLVRCTAMNETNP